MIDAFHAVVSLKDPRALRLPTRLVILTRLVLRTRLAIPVLSPRLAIPMLPMRLAVSYSGARGDPDALNALEAFNPRDSLETLDAALTGSVPGRYFNSAPRECASLFAPAQVA